MKRRFAVAMSAVLAASSVMPVMAESETATEFTPTTTVGEFSIIAEGQNMLFSVKAEQFAEDGVSYSASVTLPASLTGAEEDTVYGLDDIARVVSGDLYINVAEIDSVVQDLSGSSISAVLSLIGVDQDWIEIPATDIENAEADGESNLDALVSDDLPDDIFSWVEYLDIQTAEDGSKTITFDGPALLDIVNEGEAKASQMLDAINAALNDLDVSQITGVYADYIAAISEAINEVTPDVSVEDAQSLITEVVGEFVKQYTISTLPTLFADTYGETLSEYLQQAIDEGSTLNGTIVLNADSTMSVDIDALKEGEEIALDASFDGTNGKATVTENGNEVASANVVLTEQDNSIGFSLTASAGEQSYKLDASVAVLDEGVSISVIEGDGQSAFVGSIISEDGVSITDVEAPQATLLRDVVKNVTKIVYSAAVSEDETAEESSTVAAE